MSERGGVPHYYYPCEDWTGNSGADNQDGRDANNPPGCSDGLGQYSSFLGNQPENQYPGHAPEEQLNQP